MREALFQSLRPIRGRQQSMFLVRCLGIGLLVAAVAGLIIGTVRVAFGLELPLQLSLGILAIGPLLSLIVGLALRRNWHDAALAVDGHYGLKDRAVTALAFANQNSTNDLHQLQMTDAMSHLSNVEPKAVVPMKAPKGWAFAAVGLACGLALMLFPLSQPEAEAAAQTPEHILAMAEKQKAESLPLLKKLEEMFQDAEDATEEEKQGVKDLLQKAKDKLDELMQEGMSEQEALAKLSELSAEKQALATLLNPAALEGALASLGTALAASTPFEGAGKALMKGDLEKAAKEFEKLDEVKLTPKEAKDLEQKLREQQKKAGDAGQGSLGDAIGELADAIKGGGKSGVGKAGKNIAKKINTAIRKKKAANLLDALEENLKEGKCDCQNNGGAKVKKTEKSNSPSSNWGRAVSGNTDGERTKLGSKRNELQVTGTPSDDGESEVETTTTPEARQRASKEYQEKFQKGKKESQAVLESEPIPLGHRQTVKKYFESIRPSNSDAFETKPEAKK